MSSFLVLRFWLSFTRTKKDVLKQINWVVGICLGIKFHFKTLFKTFFKTCVFLVNQALAVWPQKSLRLQSSRLQARAPQPSRGNQKLITRTHHEKVEVTKTIWLPDNLIHVGRRRDTGESTNSSGHFFNCTHLFCTEVAKKSTSQVARIL